MISVVIYRLPDENNQDMAMSCIAAVLHSTLGWRQSVPHEGGHAARRSMQIDKVPTSRHLTRRPSTFVLDLYCGFLGIVM